MLSDLHHHARDCGLELHPDKTTVTTNVSRGRGRTTKTHINIGDMRIQMLKYHEHATYLGRVLSFDSYHAKELDNRIATGRRKFNLLRGELTSKVYPLNRRLRLFDGTITPSVLYGRAAWTLTKDMVTKLQRTQRRFLRIVIGTATHKHDDNNHKKCQQQ